MVIHHLEKWLVVNAITGKIVQGNYSAISAREAADTLNAHEVRNNRPSVYTIQERKGE